MNAIFGVKPIPKIEFEENLELLKSCSKILDKHLKDRQHLVGEGITLADVVCAIKFMEPV